LAEPGDIRDLNLWIVQRSAKGDVKVGSTGLASHLETFLGLVIRDWFDMVGHIQSQLTKPETQGLPGDA